MGYFYVGLGGLMLLWLFLLFFCRLKRRRAKKRVSRMGSEEKQRRLNELLPLFGFYYNGCDDTVGSGMYPWQREMGYCLAYDEAAPSMNMVFECEPIYFDYAEKHYLIELWKGQYGCCTGAEIGVYVSEKAGAVNPKELFYECVSDEERLPMQFCLYKGEKPILRRSGVHWWLTGFLVGMFSEAEELVLEAGIGFPNRRMCAAFCEGLLRAGYAGESIRVEQLWVYFTFRRPHCPQPAVYPPWYLRRINKKNRRSCRLYRKITEDFSSTLDRISFLTFCFPMLRRMAVRLGVKCTPGRLRRCRKSQRRRTGRRGQRASRSESL